MLIEINTDKTIEATEKMQAYYETTLAESFKRYEDKITHLDVHLGDENGSGKTAVDDKRCMMEARISGIKNVAVTNHSDTIEKAVAGAVTKLKNALEHSIGKLQNH